MSWGIDIEAITETLSLVIGVVEKPNVLSVGLCLFIWIGDGLGPITDITGRLRMRRELSTARIGIGQQSLSP